MSEWIADHKTLLASLAALSVITFVGTLIVIPLLVIRIPEDYFTEQRRRPVAWWDRRPLLRVAALGIKNVLGVVFVAAGVAMLVLPGQGVMTIIIGLMLLDFPGKFRLERWLVSRGPVIRSMNWIRSKARRPSIMVPEKTPPPKPSRVADKCTPGSGPN